MRIHEPNFPPDSALFIIWAEGLGDRFSVAAGCFAAVNAAWPALANEYPGYRLIMQNGARIMEEREALR